MRKARIAPAARADLDAIWTYTAGRWNIDQAEAYLRSLAQTMQMLADKPGLGKNIEDVKPGYFKFPSGSHVIFFRQSASGIDVIRILHKSMDAERHV
jgi:toxin ParE1/3/4